MKNTCIYVFINFLLEMYGPEKDLAVVDSSSSGLHFSQWGDFELFLVECLLLSRAYHSSWKGWLVLWAYGSGQKTQHCQLYYAIVIKFILDPNNVKY